MKFFLFDQALALMNATPLGVVHKLGTLLGRIAWLANGDTHMRETHVRLCFPELDEEARTDLAKRSLGEAGKTVLEGGKMWRGDPEELLALMSSPDGESLIESARQRDAAADIAAAALRMLESSVSLLKALRHDRYVQREEPARLRRARPRCPRAYGRKLVPANDLVEYGR